MGPLEGISYGFRFSSDMGEKVMQVGLLDLPHLPFDGCQPYIPVLISRCSGPSVQEGASPKNR